MTRIALDTDAVNRLADTPGLLEASQKARARGSLVFIVSHVVADEADRREHLLKVWAAMPKVAVRTRSAIWRVSWWGQATWSDGG
jgi:hypothetical protein